MALEGEHKVEVLKALWTCLEIDTRYSSLPHSPLPTCRHSLRLESRAKLPSIERTLHNVKRFSYFESFHPTNSDVPSMMNHLFSEEANQCSAARLRSPQTLIKADKHWYISVYSNANCQKLSISLPWINICSTENCCPQKWKWIEDLWLSLVQLSWEHHDVYQRLCNPKWISSRFTIVNH